MRIQHYESMVKGDDRIHKSAVAFIEQLRAAGVPLKVIERNDWNSCPLPKVYLDMRGEGSRPSWDEKMCRGYTRHDRHGVRQAVAFYKSVAWK